MGVTPELLEIIDSLPTQPRSGELLLALVRAEQAGYKRGAAEGAVAEEVLQMPEAVSNRG